MLTFFHMVLVYLNFYRTTMSHQLVFQNVPYQSPCHCRSEVPLRAHTQGTVPTAPHVGTVWDTRINKKKTV